MSMDYFVNPIFDWFKQLFSYWPYMLIPTLIGGLIALPIVLVSIHNAKYRPKHYEDVPAGLTEDEWKRRIRDAKESMKGPAGKMYRKISNDPRVIARMELNASRGLFDSRLNDAVAKENRIKQRQREEDEYQIEYWSEF